VSKGWIVISTDALVVDDVSGPTTLSRASPSATASFAAADMGALSVFSIRIESSAATYVSKLSPFCSDTITKTTLILTALA
jgi:hypothetical protein